MAIDFYTRETIEHARWPDTALGQMGQAYLTPLIQQGPSAFVDNLQAEMALIILNDKVLPIYINNGEDHACYMVSPSCFYFLCGAAEFKHTSNIAYKVLFSCLKGMSRVSRWAHFDKTVHINQWLMPTNPSQALSDDEIKTLKRFLAEHYPKHAWLFKSINPHYTPDNLHRFDQNAFDKIRTRFVYLWDKDQVISKNRRYLKKDEALLKEPDVEITPDMNASHSSSLQSLYKQVYFDKYDVYNPAFNERYFQLFTQTPHVSTVVARAHDQIHGFYTRIALGNEQILGIVGHNLETNETKGIYRRLFSHCLKEAESVGSINLSGGIGQFKRNRGAKAVEEYDACYVKHLPFSQRVLWKALSWATQQPFMEKIGRDV